MLEEEVLKVNAAIIGCGRMGYRGLGSAKAKALTAHSEAYIANPHVNLVALSESDPQRRAEVAEGGHKVYSDYRQMLRDERIDILSICTRTESHAEICIEAAPHVKVIFCEKPIAAGLTDAAAMIGACRKHRTLLAINHARRWHARLAQARKLVPGIGDIVGISARCNIGLMNTGTHLFDTLRFLFGEIIEVRGRVLLDGNDDPGGRADLRFAGGFVANIESAWYEYNCFELDAHGTKGILSWNETTKEGLVVYRQGRHFAGDAFELSRHRIPARTPKPMIMGAVDNLVECVRGRATPICDGNDGYKAVETAVACHLSSMNGGAAIALPLPAGQGLRILPRQTSLTKSGKL
jgi:predicted dehydrogenase